QTVVVRGNGNTTVETDKTFTVNLSNATGQRVDIARAAGTGTILNDDATAFSVNDVTTSVGPSGTTAFTFTVSLSNPSAFPESVQVHTADGPATAAGGDYQPVHGLVLTFAPGGPLTQTVTVLVNGNPTVAADKTFSVNLSHATGTG